MTGRVQEPSSHKPHSALIAPAAPGEGAQSASVDRRSGRFAFGRLSAELGPICPHTDSACGTKTLTLRMPIAPV